MTQTQTHMVVAIDGPAGSGKSTAARLSAERLGYTLLDTGAIYRTVALLGRRRDVAWDDGPGLAALAEGLPLSFRLENGKNRVFLGDEEISEAIRTPQISSGASRVSALPEVRTALLELQRAAARRGPVVAEGRDIGTVVFPGAPLKVFLDAQPEERAKRRLAELRAAGQPVTLEQVLEQQNARDEADQSRAVAPLKPAEDAVIVDTSALTIDQVVARIVELAWQRRSSGE